MKHPHAYDQGIHFIFIDPIVKNRNVARMEATISRIAQDILKYLAKLQSFIAVQKYYIDLKNKIVKTYDGSALYVYQGIDKTRKVVNNQVICCTSRKAKRKTYNISDTNIPSVFLCMFGWI